jgi:pentatricopeptide repeat protein
LIARASDYETAKGWFDEMVKKGLAPNEVTYSTLVNRAKDYETAKGWFDEMVKKGSRPTRSQVPRWSVTLRAYWKPQRLWMISPLVASSPARECIPRYSRSRSII